MTARSLADAIGAEIVDDRGLVLTEQSMTLVREQVRQRAERCRRRACPRVVHWLGVSFNDGRLGDAALDEERRRLAEQVAHHQLRYHRDDDPEISDQEYDALVQRLATLEAQLGATAPGESTGFIPSVAERVGAPVRRDFRTVAHRLPMLSLQNVLDEASLRGFDTRLSALVSAEHRPLRYAVGQDRWPGIEPSLRGGSAGGGRHAWRWRAG